MLSNRTLRLLGRQETRAAFTLPEILVVIGVIAVLIALLLPALAGALRTSDMAKSQNHMKQIASFMTLYSGDNRETVLPSQFDYTASAAAGYPVKVRANAPTNPYKGTWADIIWTVYKLNTLDTNAGGNYQADSPDKTVYDNVPNFDSNPLRSAAAVTRDIPNADGNPRPFGNGAREASYPGYFAANNFFNTNPGGPAAPQKWWTTGQIKAPDRSMYLVDSLAGETIEPLPVAPPPPIPSPVPASPTGPFDNTTLNANGIPTTLEVDFRYSGVCLMLFLDGHSRPVSSFKDLNDLEFGSQHIRVRNLDRN